MMTLAYRLAVDALRSRRFTVSLDSSADDDERPAIGEVADTAPSADALMVDMERRVALASAVGSLNESDRADFEAFRDGTEIPGVSEGALRVRRHRLVAKLRAAVG
jgi:DNA-directed RNA polymerase specialized sigma24 family protein